MPISNPRRALTTRGKDQFLLTHLDAPVTSEFFQAKAYLVQAADIAALTQDVTAVTLGTFGLATGTSIGPWVGPVTSGVGKRYIRSAVIVNGPNTVTAGQTIIGVMVGMDETVGNALAFLEFDDPVELNENGEKVVFAIEIGFDQQALYIVPRVMEVGQ